MKRTLIGIIGIALCAISVIAVHIVYAQDATTDLTLSSIPLNPLPGDKVDITAQSYGTDLTQDNMVWTYNGKTIASGTGITQASVIAPASGITGTITVTASGSSISPTSASLVLRPASVDLLWEGADSYTPPFYKGRALPSIGGVVRVVAVPTSSAPANLSYSWSENSNAMPDNSGYNKSSILFQNDALNPSEHIEVSEENGSFTGNGDINITPGEPTVVAYFNNNGFIDYANGSTDNLTTNGTGAIIHFEPFYFSAPHTISKDLNVTYTDNAGNALTASDLENEIKLSRPDGGGDSQFNINITTATYSLQNLQHLFDINFI